jgi:hypothetical protein
MFEIFLHLQNIKLTDNMLLILCTIGLVAIIISIFIAMYALASISRIFSWPIEETILLITRGNKLDNLVPAIPGWTHKRENGELVMIKGSPPKQNALLNFLGMCYISFPTEVYGYQSLHYEWCIVGGNSSDLKIVAVNQFRNHLKFYNTIPILTYVHAKGNVPLQVRFQITTRAIYPGRTIFRTRSHDIENSSDWQTVVTGIAIATIRDFAGTLTPNELTSLAYSSENSELSQLFSKNNKKLLEVVGQEIFHVSFLGHSPVDDPTIKKAMTIGYVSEQEAIGIINIGRAEADVTILKNSAITQNVQGVEIRALEVVEKAPGLVITDGKGSIPILSLGERRIITP